MPDLAHRILLDDRFLERQIRDHPSHELLTQLVCDPGGGAGSFRPTTAVARLLDGLSTNSTKDLREVAELGHSLLGRVGTAADAATANARRVTDYHRQQLLDRQTVPPHVAESASKELDRQATRVERYYAAAKELVLAGHRRVTAATGVPFEPPPGPQRRWPGWTPVVIGLGAVVIGRSIYRDLLGDQQRNTGTTLGR